MTKDELIELAREGMEMHSPKAPEYIVCAALIEALEQPEPWEKFCDSNCVWTDHHPDCKLAQKRCTPNCEELLEKIVLQRKPLTIEQLNLIGTPWHFNLLSVKDKADLFAFARAIESAHGIENKA